VPDKKSSEAEREYKSLSKKESLVKPTSQSGHGCGDISPNWPACPRPENLVKKRFSNPQRRGEGGTTKSLERSKRVVAHPERLHGPICVKASSWTCLWLLKSQCYRGTCVGEMSSWAPRSKMRLRLRLAETHPYRSISGARTWPELPWGHSLLDPFNILIHRHYRYTTPTYEDQISMQIELQYVHVIPLGDPETRSQVQRQQAGISCASCFVLLARNYYGYTIQGPSRSR